MIYRKLKNGIHAIGFKLDGKFIVYASAFDAREAKALIRAIAAVMDLFHTTSGGWTTMVGDRELSRGSSPKSQRKSLKRQNGKTKSKRSPYTLPVSNQ